VTGQVDIPTAVRPHVSLVTGAANDLSFIIGVYQDSPAGSLVLRLFRLRITAAGRPGSLTGLPRIALPIPTGPTVLAGIRELDATAPGSDLLDSRLITGVPARPAHPRWSRSDGP
jgi:hypothetical protein